MVLCGITSLASINSQTSTQFFKNNGRRTKKLIADVTYPTNGISPTRLKEAITLPKLLGTSCCTSYRLETLLISSGSLPTPLKSQ